MVLRSTPDYMFSLRRATPLVPTIDFQVIINNKSYLWSSGKWWGATVRLCVCGVEQKFRTRLCVKDIGYPRVETVLIGNVGNHLKTTIS